MTIKTAKIRIHPEGVEICSCGAPFENHPICPACQRAIGKGHILEELIEFRGDHLCKFCIVAWEKYEAVIKKKTKVDYKVSLAQLLDSHQLPAEIKLLLWGKE
jgi:hypothetical protein